MRLLLSRFGVTLLILSLVNCSAWHATQAPLSELEGKKVRISAKSGDRREGELVDADSMGFAVLQGERESKNRYDISAKPNILTFDTSKIALVEERVFSTGRTVALVTSVALLLGLVAVVTAIARSE